jgi:FMN phosphatase YigB (HAD superfamily)
MKSGIIFDLDGTLYDATGIDAENRSAALNAISEFFAVSENEANSLLGRAQQTNGVASISRALFVMGVPDSVFLKHQLASLHPEQHIKSDPLLANLVRQAMATYKIALYTNTRRELVPRIIKCIGFLGDEFSVVVAGGDVREPKPSIFELQNVVKQLGIPPSDCFAVGDRWAVDLAPAASIGMTPIHVNSRDELVQWLQSVV